MARCVWTSRMGGIVSERAATAMPLNKPVTALTADACLVALAVPQATQAHRRPRQAGGMWLALMVWCPRSWHWKACPMERHVAEEGSRSELGDEGEKLALGTVLGLDYIYAPLRIRMSTCAAAQSWVPASHPSRWPCARFLGPGKTKNPLAIITPPLPLPLPRRSSTPRPVGIGGRPSFYLSAVNFKKSQQILGEVSSVSCG
jgi:hypothetical protein